jgi:hypothetical protein
MFLPRPAVWILAGVASLLPTTHVKAENTAKKLLVGDTKVEIIAKYQGEALPKPDKALIHDFTVPSSVISVDESPAARLHRRPRVEGAAANSPEAVAQQVRASFSKALLHELQQASVPAATAPGADSPVPPNTLQVKGEFTAINEGNKTKRVLIGFGKGASDVQAHVTVSLATEQQPVVLLEFNVKSQSGKKPGAAATIGAGAATMGTASAGSAAAGVAAGGVMDRAASVEADASRMAKGVAKQIAELMSSQPWAAPQPPEPKER